MASRTGTASHEKEVERKKVLISTAKKSTSNALNDAASLRGRVAVAGLRAAELLSSASAASNQI